MANCEPLPVYGRSQIASPPSRRQPQRRRQQVARGHHERCAIEAVKGTQATEYVEHRRAPTATQAVRVESTFRPTLGVGYQPEDGATGKRQRATARTDDVHYLHDMRVLIQHGPPSLAPQIMNTRSGTCVVYVKAIERGYRRLYFLGLPRSLEGV